MKTIIILFILLNTQLYSQWVNIGLINGGDIKKVTQDSLGYLYAATSTNLIYRSTDNGASWEKFSNGFPDARIESLISTNNSVFAATYGWGIYRTIDQGQNWVSSDSGITTNYSISFALDDDYLFAGTQHGVYRSSNDGILWENVTGEIGSTHGVHAMIISSDSNMFATTSIGSSGSMYRSTNKGNNWTLVNNGLPSFYMSKLDYCSNRVYTADGDWRLYFTSNYGDQWQAAGNFNGSSPINSISTMGNIIGVGSYTTGSPQISTNCGSSWNIRNQGLPLSNVNDMLITQEYILAALIKGVYKSTNLGVNWFNSSSGLGGVEVLDVYSLGNIVLSGTSGFGLLRSTNYGYNWSQISFTDNFSCENFLYCDSIFYFNNYNTIYKTSDKGLTWSEYGTPIPFGLNTFTVKSNQALIGAFIDGIYKSSNGGLNWFSAMNGVSNTFIYSTIFLTRDSITYAHVNDLVDSSTLYFSTNFGAQWIPILNNGLNFAINTLVYNGGTLYAGTMNDGVYISQNGGFNFLPNNNGLPLYTNISSFSFHNDTVYASSRGGGIFKRYINSNLWTTMNDGVSNNIFNIINSGIGYLYAGGTGGLFLRNSTVVNLSNNSNELPGVFLLHQNYPNPFNPSTIIEFDLQENIFASLKIFDALGREVETLAFQNMDAGNYRLIWDAANFPSGIYFYKMKAGNFAETKRMMLLK